MDIVSQNADLLVDLEHLPPRRMMNKRWMLILTSCSFVLLSYTIVIKYLEFKLLQDYLPNEQSMLLFKTNLVYTFSFVILFTLIFVGLASFIPLDYHTYSQKFKTIGTILMFAILLVVAINFTSGYYNVKAIVMEYHSRGYQQF